MGPRRGREGKVRGDGTGGQAAVQQANGGVFRQEGRGRAPPRQSPEHNRQAYAHQAAHAATAATHAAYHPDPQQQHYDHAAAAAHHAYYVDPNAAYYADPNAQHADPYGQHAVYYQ